MGNKKVPRKVRDLPFCSQIPKPHGPLASPSPSLRHHDPSANRVLFNSYVVKRIEEEKRKKRERQRKAATCKEEEEKRRKWRGIGCYSKGVAVTVRWRRRKKKRERRKKRKKEKRESVVRE
jgi:hypothetical protein